MNCMYAEIHFRPSPMFLNTKQRPVLVLGTSSVGKTSLLLRYTNNEFRDDTRSTIGVDFRHKDVLVGDSTMAECQIWDTAGQERFSPISKEYYRGAHGCAIVYDITDRSSFDGLRGVKFWMNELEQILRFSETSKKFPIVLIGNKSDLSHQRTVETEEGIDMAKKFKIAFFETSAKGDQHVAEAFNELVTQIVQDNENSKRLKSSRGSSEVDEDDSGSLGDSKFEKIDLHKTIVVQVEKKRSCCQS